MQILKSKYLKIVKRWKPVELLNWLGLPAAIVYIFSMFVAPWFYGHASWYYVQEVWGRWQSLNVGMIAFISSVVALNISRMNADEQRKREFVAAKAFLPEALSELVSYFKLSASILVRGWEANRNEMLQVEVPKLPDSYREVFGQCIKHAEPEVGDSLSRLLVWLQVHDSRLNGFVSQFNDDSYINPDRHNLITYLYRLGELQALVNKLFDFARSIERFDATPLVWEDFRNAYMNLDIWAEEFHIDERMNLEAFTKRAIERDESQNA